MKKKKKKKNGVKVLEIGWSAEGEDSSNLEVEGVQRYQYGTSTRCDPERDHMGYGMKKMCRTV